ncbi:hypothetical protein DVH05_017954 [Phytophthora capsici]|nr:hypothetical protein DVH05_023779 [Phytophthora capsici]KAG1696732.1 hypothetical protein DVH05_017954 [Phytophthora capsici]
MVDLPKGHVNVSFKEAFESIDVDFVLDKDGVQRCKNAINAFSKDCGLGVLDDDEAEEIVVFIDDFEVLQASQIMTMDKFHNISTVLKKVERAMDWVSNLRQSVFEDVMIGFDEFTSTEKHEHNLAIACCNLKESRSQILDLSTQRSLNWTEEIEKRDYMMQDRWVDLTSLLQAVS